jgi:N-acylneuraminate cytidylyltransferase
MISNIKSKKFCFIFARGGSVRLKHKNIKIFKKKPLIYQSIKLAKKSKLFSKIFVSTDSIKISRIAKKYGAKVIKRPKKFATSKVEEFLAWKHAVKYLESKRLYFDIFVSLPCTAPLREIKDVEKCIKSLKSKDQLVMTYFYGDLNNKLSIKQSKNKINYILNTYNKNSKKVAHLTTVAYVTTPSYINKYKNLLDGQISLEEVPKIRAVDINDIVDFKFAENLINKKK